MTINQTHTHFILKLRTISGEFDIAKMKHGLQAMEYDVQTISEEGSIFFYINGVSTRLLQIKNVERGLDLYLPPYSSHEDWELMRDWLLVFNSFYTAIAIAENDLVEDIEQFFNPAKIEKEQKNFSVHLQHLMRSDDTLHFWSIHREFYSGTKIFERVREQTEMEHLPFLYSLIRKSQYTTLNARNSTVEKVNKNLSTCYSLLNNEENIVLQPADMIMIKEEEKEAFFISYNSIDKLIFHGCVYLDEKQIFLPKMNDADWKNFCTHAREMSINTELFSKYVEGEEEEEDN